MLLFVDGFDHFGNATDIIATGKWGTILSGAASLSSTTIARTGTGSFKPTNSGGLYATKTYTTSGGVVMGGALQLTTGTYAAVDLFQVLEGSIVHLAVGVTTGGLLTVKRGSTVLQTGTTVLGAANWNYIELKGTIHDTTGSYELRINGITELSATNVDTQNAGTGVWNRVALGGTSASNSYWDDFYLCDTSGSAPRNTFLGPIKIETLMPQTDAVSAGVDAGLTPSTGTDHGALVDEIPPNTSDYNGSATVNARDLYQYPSMTLSGTVLGVQTNMYVAKSDLTARTVACSVRTATTVDGAAISPSTTFQYISEIRPVEPFFLAEWLTTDIATVQVGMKVVS